LPYHRNFAIFAIPRAEWRGYLKLFEGGRVDFGTSVLVLPLRPVAALAKELASLDRLSGGRLIVSAAAGWLESMERLATATGVG
jgi:hypothetical protein